MILELIKLMRRRRYLRAALACFLATESPVSFGDSKGFNPFQDQSAKVPQHMECQFLYGALEAQPLEGLFSKRALPYGAAAGFCHQDLRVLLHYSANNQVYDALYFKKENNSYQDTVLTGRVVYDFFAFRAGPEYPLLNLYAFGGFGQRSVRNFEIVESSGDALQNNRLEDRYSADATVNVFEIGAGGEAVFDNRITFGMHVPTILVAAGAPSVTLTKKQDQSAGPQRDAEGRFADKVKLVSAGSSIFFVGYKL